MAFRKNRKKHNLHRRHNLLYSVISELLLLLFIFIVFFLFVIFYFNDLFKKILLLLLLLYLTYNNTGQSARPAIANNQPTQSTRLYSCFIFILFFFLILFQNCIHFLIQYRIYICYNFI